MKDGQRDLAVVPGLLIPRLVQTSPCTASVTHLLTASLQGHLGPLASHPGVEGISWEHTPHRSGSTAWTRSSGFSLPLRAKQCHRLSRVVLN